MTRLDSAIRRLQAQRACLDHACALIADVPGVVLELGLGNGRTYDHLRARLPGREIFAFDRQVAAHPDCVPDAAHLVLGDLRETLDAVRKLLAGRAALAHLDIGTGDKTASLALAADLAGWIAPLLAAGAVIVADQPLAHAGWEPLPLPAGVALGRYYMLRSS